MSNFNIHKNGEKERIKYPPGGNMRVISCIAENTGRLVSGKLPMSDVKEFAKWRYYYSTEDTRNWLDSLDTEGLALVMSSNTDWWIRWNTLDTAMRVAEPILEKNPRLLKDFVEIIVNAIQTVPEDDLKSSMRGPFSLLRFFRVNYDVRDKYPESDFLDFFRAYGRSIYAFEGLESYKVENQLEKILKYGIWRKYFLWVELFGVKDTPLLSWEYEKLSKVFRSLTEEDLRFLANILPKFPGTTSVHLIDTYLESKKVCGDKNEAKWLKIQKALTGHNLGILYFQDSGIRGDLDDKRIEDIEFIGSFGKIARSEPDRWGLQSILKLRDVIIESNGKIDTCSKDTIGNSKIFSILASIESKKLGSYMEAIVSEFDTLPSLEILERYIHESERLACVYPNPYEDRHKGFLLYLIRFSHISSALSDLESFLEKVEGRYMMKVITILPKDYETNWYQNPLYLKAVNTKLTNPNNPKEFQDDNSALFLSLGASGLDIALCERLYSDMSISKDIYRNMNHLKDYGLRDSADIQSLASLVQYRPKSYHKVLVHIFSVFQEYVDGIKFSNFFRHKLWKQYSSAEIEELAGNGRESFRGEIHACCSILGENTSTYEKVCQGFERACKLYHDIGNNIDKFKEFEEVLISLEIKCMYNALCECYTSEAGIEADELTPDILEDESIMVAVKVLLHKNKINAEVGKNLLKKLIENRGKTYSYIMENGENQKWFQENLSEEQLMMWNSEQKRIFPVIGELRKSNETLQSEIDKFLRVASGIIRKLSLEREICLDNYDLFLQEIPEFLEKHKDLDVNIRKNIELQVNSIKRLLTRGKSRSVQEVTIYHELDAKNIVMMGDWVDGSCLSSSSGVKNNWSVVSNACEGNKAVFYARDEKGNILGRLLVAIDNNKKLVVFGVYTRGFPDVDLQKIFEMYIRDFAINIGLEFSGDPKKVEKILGCDWYIDPVWKEISSIAK